MDNQTCQCGRVWKLTKHKLPVRDKDSIDCKCGREIISWNGGVAYTAELIKDIPAGG